MLGIFKKKSFKAKYIDLWSGLEDIPLFNLEKILVGKFQYLLKNESEIEFIDPIRIQERYDKIMDEYHNALGIDLENEEYFIIQIKLTEARHKYINGDRTAINRIRLFEKELAQMRNSETKVNHQKTRIRVEKWLGHRIDPKQTTGLEFVEMINLMKEEYEQLKNRNGTNKEY